jgi:hypothetical protein
MENWLKIFSEIGQEVQEVAQRISGSKEAKKYLGQGAGGDITRGIDKAVEDVILKRLKDVGNVISQIHLMAQVMQRTEYHFMQHRWPLQNQNRR